MSTIIISTIQEARASAAEWLFDHLADRFAAGIPEHDSELGLWRIPVWLSYPGLEPLGPIGDLVLDDTTGQVREHTPIDDLKARALKLYQQNRERIEAPLS